MKNELCLQERTGSCLGCPILEIAVTKASVSRDRLVQNAIIKTVEVELCPGKETKIIIPELIRGRQGRLISQERR